LRLEHEQVAGAGRHEQQPAEQRGAGGPRHERYSSPILVGAPEQSRRWVTEMGKERRRRSRFARSFFLLLLPSFCASV
jgi:hypothetical protein